ncbi:Sec-independent protein translocase subunit TatA [Streptomyces sp. J2-1]|uniref:Sec-independent protein translocase subunit TatA n=1 Tax=Streptomyces corallincola TaxID=2851888 RepID=UPI001C385A68|nr:Sec-independent protein translocase subunit TatA [Streptomyces corallincola]MBV2355834.1 Sec-independent protein translocase subunit TatA [Streptomyces corallincola]
MFRSGLEPWHLLVFALVIILVFGSKKLPDMARSLGKSARILKSEAKAMKDEANKPDAGTAQSTQDPAPAQRTIHAAPGDVTSARPVTEPTDSTSQR